MGSEDEDGNDAAAARRRPSANADVNADAMAVDLMHDDGAARDGFGSPSRAVNTGAEGAGAAEADAAVTVGTKRKRGAATGNDELAAEDVDGYPMATPASAARGDIAPTGGELG
jgi:hypothetical protein